MEYSPRQGYDKSKTLLVFHTRVLGHHHHHPPLLVWVAPSFEFWGQVECWGAIHQSEGSWIVNEKASKENFWGPKQIACVVADLCVGCVCGPAKSLHIVWLT